MKARQWWQSGGKKMSMNNLNIMLHCRLPSCDRVFQPYIYALRPVKAFDPRRKFAILLLFS
jgi:hypothetical protein